MTQSIKKKTDALRLDANYKTFLTDIKKRLNESQLRAAFAVNNQLINFYWQLGREIIEKQKMFKWGDQFLTQFSDDLRKAVPGLQGFSVTNLKRMRLFAQAYPDFEIGAQAVHQLPWGHIVLILHRVRAQEERNWYSEQVLKNGWSRSILEMQIESGLYGRQAKKDKKLTNFKEHLPKAQSDLAHDILKDPYHFDFLTIQSKAHERAIEEGLIAHMRDFLLELGQGFAFVGSQVPLTIDDQEFFVDLLFYHLNLRAFVVCELKASKFKPEHTGQLSFYLSAVDDLLRKEGDNQTIGILLCQSKNKVVAEYALRNIKAPIGVSEYKLSKSLPKELKTSLPTIEELEAELNEIVKLKE